MGSIGRGFGQARRGLRTIDSRHVHDRAARTTFFAAAQAVNSIVMDGCALALILTTLPTIS
jgi:hypothetical protein